jgi:hypothetical protein
MTDNSIRVTFHSGPDGDWLLIEKDGQKLRLTPKQAETLAQAIVVKLSK